MGYFRKANVTNIALSILILQMVFTDIATVRGDPDTTVEDIQCSVQRWGQNSTYGTLVETVLNDLAAEGASQPHYDYYIDYSSDDNSAIAYGYSLCSLSLSQQDCTTCLAQSQEDLLTNCPFCVFAQVKLTDCFMRYDDYAFYG